jgi:hypothetical protein
MRQTNQIESGIFLDIGALRSHQFVGGVLAEAPRAVPSLSVIWRQTKKIAATDSRLRAGKFFMSAIRDLREHGSCFSAHSSRGAV